MKALLLAAVLVGGPWSLQDCIEYALEHNISIQQSSLSVDQREVDLNTAMGRRLPGVSASTSQNFSFGRGLTADNTYANTNTTNTSFSLGGDMTLFSGFQLRDNIRLSSLNLEAATADLQKAREDISLAVAKAYVQILYDYEILDVARRQIEIDSLQTDRLTFMEQNGKSSSAEVSAQRATLAQSRVTAVQAENNLRLALLDLTQLLELESPDGFDIVRPDVDNFDLKLLPDPETIYSEAVGSKPVVRAEEIRLDYALASIKLAKGAFLPSLSLSGGLGTNYYTSSGYPHAGFSSQLKNNFSQYVGLNLSIPIFSRFSTRNNVKSAQISFRNQELQLENVKKSLFKEIQQAYYSAVASQGKYQSQKAAAASAEESFELMSAKYENGKAGITEFNESKNRYLEAESNLIQSQYEYLFQSAVIDFYRGRELTL